MIAKKYRLLTKEVNYILHKRQTISCPDFLFFIIPQYNNRPYNQYSLQLSTKVHKRAVKRNKLRRMFYDYIEQSQCLLYKNIKIWNKYYKTLAMIHKTKIEEWHTLLESKNRTEIKKKVIYNIDKFKNS